MALRQKSPTPLAFFSASVRIFPSFRIRYFTCSWSRYSLCSWPPSKMNFSPGGISTSSVTSSSAFSHIFAACTFTFSLHNAPCMPNCPSSILSPSVDTLRVTVAIGCPSHPSFVRALITASLLPFVNNSSTFSAGMSLSPSKYFPRRSGILLTCCLSFL